VMLQTLNGSVHATLPASIEGNFDLLTGNGTVQSDIPLGNEASSRYNRHLSGQIGMATRTVRMHTTNGRIVLTAKGRGSSEH